MIRIASGSLALAVCTLCCQAGIAGVVAPGAVEGVGVLTFDPAAGLFLLEKNAPRRISGPPAGNMPIVESQPSIEIVVAGAGGLRLSELAISNILGRASGGIFAVFDDGVERVMGGDPGTAGDAAIIAALGVGDAGLGQQAQIWTTQGMSLAAQIDLSFAVIPYITAPRWEPRMIAMPATSLTFVSAPTEDERPASRKIKKTTQVAGSTADPLAQVVAVGLVLVYAYLIWNLR